MRSRPADRAPLVAWATAFGLLVVMRVAYGIDAALHFAQPPMDGPFQLYNPLRRIAAGERGGVDFQFFHGIAIPYLHYVPFRILGGTFLAAEVSRQLVAALSATVLPLFVFRAFTGSWRRSFAMSTILVSVMTLIGLLPIDFAAYSLLGIRSALPLLVPLLWTFPLERRRRAVLAGAAIGAAIMLGTEQGLAVLIAVMVVTAIGLAVPAQRRDVAIELGLMMLTTILTVIVIGVAIGGVAGLTGAMRFNLVVVPRDEYWYFGVPPNPFITGWLDVRTRLGDTRIVPAGILALLLLSAMTIRDRWKTRREANARGAALSMLTLYSVLSCASLLGMFAIHYADPFARALMIVALIEAERALAARSDGSSRQWLSLDTIGIAAVLAMLVARVDLMKTLAESVPRVISESARGMHQQLDDMWPEAIATGQRVVDTHRDATGAVPVIWSTYAGLLEARNGVFHPSTDYIIHALGPEARARYLADFRNLRPEVVQTVRPTFSNYERWLEHTTWDFYSELLRSYRVVDSTRWSVFWERTGVTLAQPPAFWAATFRSDAKLIEFQVPPPAPGISDTVLIEVELQYHIRNPTAWVPVFGAMPRHLVAFSGAMTKQPGSINPFAETMRFPVVAVAGRRVRLDFTTYSLLPGSGIELKAATASVIPIAPSFAPWFGNLKRASSFLSGF